MRSSEEERNRLKITLKVEYEHIEDTVVPIKRLVLKGRQFFEEEIEGYFTKVPLILLSDIKMGEIPEGVILETGVYEYDEHKADYEEILNKIPYCDTFEVSRDFIRARLEVSSIDYSHIVPIIVEAIEKEAMLHNFWVIKDEMLSAIIIEKSVIDPDSTVIEEISSIMAPICSAIRRVQEVREDSIIKSRYKTYEPSEIPIIEEPSICTESKLEMPLEALSNDHKRMEIIRLGAHLSTSKSFVGLGSYKGKKYPLVIFWHYDREVLVEIAALLDEDLEFVKLKDVIGDVEVFTEWKGAHIFLGPVEREQRVHCVKVRGEKALRLLRLVYPYLLGIKQQFADILLRGTWH